MTIIEAAFLGLLQGVTELFPISSLGHSVILPPLLGWDLSESSESFLVFLVATHFATAVVLLLFFWRDWLSIAKGMLHSVTNCRIDEANIHGKIGWLLVVATIPAGILGLLFQSALQHLFASPTYVALFLIGNGILLYATEHIRRRSTIMEIHDDVRVAGLSWWQALFVGVMQCLALFPGFSRTGATLSGGLISGLSHQDAARFAFLLATPIIFAAAVLKLPHLFAATADELAPIMVGTLCAAVAAYASVKFLTRYFRSHTLTPFAIYCFLLGSLTLIALQMFY